ncbi:hypothetical protein LRS06_02115 [Hymenobacter sp. J193]|uniref:hypothetical protein n=1 Tax=Hymenobacter sp. J193 TaxID=2898429 RepID=UPI0021507759|nr:hypothetical protein [Hymenobacter sp. J193]MCR5886586.1 hypothetical protein [Hymenobacter sp. J193]
MPTLLRLLGCLPLLAAGLVSCQKNDLDASAPMAEQVVPLRVGSTWVYRRYAFDANGTAIDSTTTTRSVVRDTIIDRHIWYILSTKELVQNNHNGYVRYNPADPEGIIVYANAGFGGSIGYNYQYPDYSLWVLTWRGAQPAPVATSWHRYHAIRYDIELQYLYPGQATPLIQKREEYVAPGLGLAHANYYARETGQLLQRLELLSFTQ